MSDDTEFTLGGYHDSAGVEHLVLIDLHSSGVWQVIDRSGDRTLLIERLDGADDGDEQAVALAESYLTLVRAFHAGDRDDMPCPHPAGQAPVVLSARPGARLLKAA